MLLRGGEKMATQSASWHPVSHSKCVLGTQPGPRICGGILRAPGVGCSWSRCLNTGSDLDLIYNLGMVSMFYLGCRVGE